ncbi:MAG: AMP-binding protein, partial [Acidimicrobiales bacterium]|nr:AMP-binding protein [Acidimicrobiales bacterium]
TALIDTDETVVTAGELVGRANQLANGLVALGHEPSDTVAAVLPNCREFIELNLAARQVGLIFTPISHHLVGPELSYIVNDLEAAVLVGRSTFGDALAAASMELDLGADRWFAIGDVDGYRTFDDLGADQPTTAPRRSLPVWRCTTRRARPVVRRGSPLYHTAVLMWTANSLHLGHAVVLMERWTPEDCLRLIDEYRVATSHMVPTQFHRMLGLPEDVRAKYDVSVDPLHGPRRSPVSARDQEADDPVVGQLDHGVLRRDRGWRRDHHRRRVAAEGGLRRQGLGRGRHPDLRRRRQPAGTQRGTIYMGLTQADFEYKGDEGKTKKNRIYEDDGSFFTVGDVGELDDDRCLFLRDRKIDMIICGGVNNYPSEIESAFTTTPMVGDVAVFGVPNDDWGEEGRGGDRAGRSPHRGRTL